MCSFLLYIKPHSGCSDRQFANHTFPPSVHARTHSFSYQLSKDDPMGIDQDKYAEEGNVWLEAHFPDTTFITCARSYTTPAGDDDAVGASTYSATVITVSVLGGCVFASMCAYAGMYMCVSRICDVCDVIYCHNISS